MCVNLVHHTTKSFRIRLAALPEQVQRLARKNYELLRADPRHPSVRLKQISTSSRGAIYSARVGRDYRAVGQMRNGELYWQWIGPHDEYDRLIRG